MLAAILVAAATSGQADPAACGRSIRRGPYPVEALKADLQVLWDILEEGHGGFDRYTHGQRAAEGLRCRRGAADRPADGARLLRSGSCLSSPRSRTVTRG
ncbi:MAG: hypothetical protein M0C28_47645 [Candidatus Moduliflexus flocculans]|nr:hypothetical protein [Candidatus Moduliflexus flocculans]